MDRLGADVRRALRGAGVPDAGELVDVVRAWPAAVGPAIARAAWPQRLARDGTLHVTAVSSTWAFELGRMEEEVRAKLAARLGGAAPPRLRFVVGNVPEPPAEPSAPPRAPLEPTPEERSSAAALASPIEDPGLREAVRRAAAASLAATRSDRDL